MGEQSAEVPVLTAGLSSVDVDSVLESQESQETETLDEPEVKKPARKCKPKTKVTESKKKSKVVAKKSKAPAKKQHKTLGAPKKKPRSKSLGSSKPKVVKQQSLGAPKKPRSKSRGRSPGRSLEELSKPKVVKQQSLEAPKKPRRKSRGRSLSSQRSLDELSKPKYVRERSKTPDSTPKRTPKAKEVPQKEPKLTRGKSVEELDQESTRLVKKIERMNSRKDEVIATKGFDSPAVKKLGKKLLTLSKKLRLVAMKRYALRTHFIQGADQPGL